MVLEIKNKIPETSAILGSEGHLTVFDQKIFSLDKPPAEQWLFTRGTHSEERS